MSYQPPPATRTGPPEVFQDWDLTPPGRLRSQWRWVNGGMCHSRSSDGPESVQEGQWLDYVIRFQNTGTDTAFNVVITDQLAANLDASSFQMLEASHPARIKRDDRALTFEFLNIQLPDSNVNEPLSHGYIKFRVKPLPTLGDGDMVNNRANIYFDYNAPVVTNTAVTAFSDPSTCHTATAASTPATCTGISNGTITVSNDNWRDSQEAALQGSSLAPTDNREAAFLTDLTAGAYTAILRGKSESGIGLIEIYNLP